MKHCIFCAAKIPQNRAGITSARHTREILEEQWELEHDCVLQSYHSTFEELNEEHNISLWLENTDIHQLINDCMEYARDKRELDIIRQKR